MLDADLFFIRVNQWLLLAVLRLISSRKCSRCEARQRAEDESLGSIMAGHCWGS